MPNRFKAPLATWDANYQEDNSSFEFKENPSYRARLDAQANGPGVGAGYWSWGDAKPKSPIASVLGMIPGMSEQFRAQGTPGFEKQEPTWKTGAPPEGYSGGIQGTNPNQSGGK